MAQPDWKGLFEWSILHNDGTRDNSAQLRQVPEEDRKWFLEAMESQQEDLVKRMKTIKAALDDRDDSEEQVAAKLQLLEDLTEIVENIDYARDLTHIGGLHTLLALLGSAHPQLRAAAAEVVATCVQNNAPVQQLFLDAGTLPRLLGLFEDKDPTCRRKALLALSCLVRHCAPAMDAFRSQGGLQRLVHTAADPDPRQQRKALQLAREVLRERPGDIRDALRGGLAPKLAAAVDAKDAGVREGALSLLALLVQHPGVVHALQQDTQLRQRLEAAQARLNGLDVEDLDAEHDALALTEHVLQKLKEPASAAAAAAESQPADVETAHAPAQGQAGSVGGGEEAAQQQQHPVALLGPP